MMSDRAAKLDGREEHFRIPGPRRAADLFLRYLPAAATGGSPRRAVLYIHGATFPSALSVAHRFGGRSWRDALAAAGFDVWALDFYGFGESARYPEMSEDAEAHPPLCGAADAADQIAAAVRFILAHQRLSQLSLISHSWGSMPAGRFAGNHPALIDRWVLFAPIALRLDCGEAPAARLPAWRIVTPEDQWSRFVEDVPAGEPPVLSRTEFAAWGDAYLDTDPGSRERAPAGVKTPLGPIDEIAQAWRGRLSYDPSRVRCPIAIIRGEWDGLLPDVDARWLFDAFSGSPVKRDVKIGRATHLMHLETMRWALWRESIAFLLADDVAPIPA